MSDTVIGLVDASRTAAVRWWRRRRRSVLLVVMTGLCLGLLGSGWVFLRGMQTREDLVRAAGLVSVLGQQMRQGNVGAARQTLTELRAATQSAKEQTADPTWRLGGHIPVLGLNLAAVRVLAEALDDVADRGFPPLLDAAASINLRNFVPQNGRIDVAALEIAAPRLAAAAASLTQARDRVSQIATDGVLPQVQKGVTLFREGMDKLIGLISAAIRAVALLPSMLGLHGPRTYLMLFQNPAELRATGGIPGAFAVIRVDRGVLQIVKQGSASADIGVFEVPVLSLPEQMQHLYGDRPGMFPANVNLMPHFPTTALLAREMYRRRSGQTVDGVLSVDPVALSYLLRATGPVPMPVGPPLTADRAVPMLLSEVYARIPNSVEQDRYFAGAARAVFDVLSRGSVNPNVAIAALAQAAGERRLLFWSANPGDREAIAGTVLEGVLPENDGVRPTVGVFLNDGSGGKLDYYLRFAAELRGGTCRSDGRRELTLQVTLRSVAPPSGLPKSVLGFVLASDPYTARTNVMIFSPTGGGILGARVEGSKEEFGTGIERGRSVGVLTLDVPPGQSRTVEATLLTDVLPAAAQVSPELWLTPAATTWQKSLDSSLTCD